MALSSHRTNRGGGSGRWRIGALLLLLALAMPHTVLANATVFVNTNLTSTCVYSYCKDASYFGVLVGPADALNLKGGTFNNDIGLYTNATLTTSGTTTFNAPVDFSNTMTNSPVPCTAGTCTGPTGNFSYGGTMSATQGIKQNTSLVSNAYTQFVAITDYWNTYASTHTASTPTMTGNWNIGTGGGIHLYSTGTTNWTTSSSALTIGCGVNLTSVCSADDLIVIIVPAGQTATITQNITFAANSGLTPDQLLFVIDSSSSTALTIGTNATRTVNGDFFLPNGAFTLGSSNGSSITNFNGRIFANSSTGTDLINHNVTLANESEVPEPATWALMVSGLAGAIWFERRRRKARA
jgi:PEP-CTERM motif